MLPQPIDILTTTKRTSRNLIRYHFTRDPCSCRHDLPITPPIRTAIDGSRWARSVEDAVVFLDAMIEFGKISPAAIRNALASCSRLHGLAQSREAAALMRRRVWSPRESRLRVVRADTLDLRARSRPQLISRMGDGHRRGHARDRTCDRWMLDPEALLDDDAGVF
jgi:hypothetical protein